MAELEKKKLGAGGEKGGGGGPQSVRAETINPFSGTNLTAVEGMHQFTMNIL